MNGFSFDVLTKDSRTQARAGVIHTPHGDIQTPAFVPVGTQATVKSLSPDDLNTLGVQLYFVNTYHMYLRPGTSIVKKMGGLHTFMQWDKPLITDSGGFQVFSLGRESRPAKHLSADEEKPQLVKIDEDGVEFRSHWDGTKHLFTPESSMQWQWELGADIHIAFDDCTPYPVTHEQARLSMERTHRWAVRSLNEHKKLSSQFMVHAKTSKKNAMNDEQSTMNNYQALYGSIQGSVYEDLRRESASFISSLDTDGIAIGGVSVGETKEEMVHVLDWVTPLLPDEKPRHLLGVGEIDDIFALVERGVDTFDCVQPTRLARMGWLMVGRDMSANWTLDITKKEFAAQEGPVDPTCACYTCSRFSRAYVHHLFRVRELLGYKLATIHNLFAMHALVNAIRQSIEDGSFLELKKQWL
jgi:queuine tRNA-ribosyltransferase